MEPAPPTCSGDVDLVVAEVAIQAVVEVVTEDIDVVERMADERTALAQAAHTAGSDPFFELLDLETTLRVHRVTS